MNRFPDLPRGTVTFLFTDIEGSTRLLQQLGDRYGDALLDHRRRLRQAFERHHGVEVDVQGDALFFAFSKATEAVAAAQEGQAGLKDTEVRVRMGLHTGEPLLTEEGYVGVDVHRAARICSSAHGGQIVLSDTTARLVEADLRDLGLHRLKDLAAPRTLYQLGHEQFRPLRTPNLSNLPVQATELIGRERECEEAAALLRDHRLVTLVGAGGTGKTRLALQVAAEVVGDFEDGVFWVPLAAVRDPELVEPTIGQALEGTENLAGYLSNRQVLLLLDNFEQVVGAAPRLAELLGSAPWLKLLVTSRESLRLSGEWEYAVPPLPQTDAVALFTERARAVRSGFASDGSVVEICRRLDGLPLALELAAARVQVLTPLQILERLGRSLDLLTTSARDLPARQRTLRATVDWSFELLDPEEQELFTRLGVFSGGCTLAAAETVCGADLDTLQSLVARSLMSQTGGRFSMLETLREYALSHLETAAERDGVRERHARYFLALAEEASPEIERGDLERAAQLSAEHNNVRGALQHFRETSASALELRLVGAVWKFWFDQGLWEESGRAVERALTLSSDATPERVWVAVGVAWTTGRRGGRRASIPAAEEALRLSRTLGDPRLIATSLRILGVCFVIEDPERSAPLFEESARLFESIGDHVGLSNVLNNLAVIASRAGDQRTAAEGFERALSIARPTGNPRAILIPLMNLAHEERELGEYRQARKLFAECLAVARAFGAREAITETLYGAAFLAGALGDYGWAGALVGAARREGDFGHVFEDDLDRLRLERTLAEVEKHLGADGLEQALAAGRALTLDAVGEYLTGAAAATGEAMSVPPPTAPPDTTAALSLVAGLDSVRLPAFMVVGRYARYDANVRNALKDARQRILAGLAKPGHKRNAHLVWAAPGSGKSYFVEQIAESLDGVCYREINLAKCTHGEFRTFLDGLDMSGQERCLYFIDECDSKPNETWPYETLLPYLDAAARRESHVAVVFAGSSGASLDSMKEAMASRPKGVDLLSRIPSTNEYAIAPMSIGDRVLVTLTQLVDAASESGFDLRAVERMALFYVAVDPRLASARQLHEFAVRAVERLQAGEDRLKYDHLFNPGDPENKAFWIQWRPYHQDLVNRFVDLAE